MLSSLRRIRTIFVLALAGGIFLGGMLFQKYKVFPYPEIVNWAKSLKKKWNPPVAMEVQAEYAKIDGEPDLARELETALLPIGVHGIRVGAAFEVPKISGGITAVGDKILIVDRLGGGYVCDGNGKLSKVTFPAVPNNIEAFAKRGEWPISNLRVHDVEYLPETGQVVIAHETYDQAEAAPRLAVSLIALDEKTMTPKGEWKTVFKGDKLTISHYAGLAGGGRLAVRSGGRVLLTAGDYNQDGVMQQTEPFAQNRDVTFGKIFEIDCEKGTHRLISIGHRNPQGLFVCANGEIISAEHGPAGGDELNLIREGGNYGWPTVSLGVDYGTYEWPPTKGKQGWHDGYDMPLFAWVPSVGVSNVIQLSGFNKRWDGDLLVASLKAGTLFRLRLDGQRVVYSEPIWLGERIRDLLQRRDGTIVLWTDDAKLLFLGVDEQKLKENRRSMDIGEFPWMHTCLACHHFGPTNESHLAPTLTEVVGRQIGGDKFTKYSPGMKGVGGSWSKELLRQFIMDPGSVVKGTTMPKVEVSPADLDRILEFLERGVKR
jgi:aldose sugar dehydrogenase